MCLSCVPLVTLCIEMTRVCVSASSICPLGFILECVSVSPRCLSRLFLIDRYGFGNGPKGTHIYFVDSKDTVGPR